MYYAAGKRILPFTLVIVGCLLLAGCKKYKDLITPVTETGTLTDVENNIYKTIKIGNQWWMAENLKVKKFRNGNPVISAQSDITWKDTVSGYCLYDNNTSAPGLLYNWYAVTDTNMLAPSGWHIATDNDWKELEKFLGMSQVDADNTGWRGTHEAEKLKIESSLSGWIRYGDVWSTNESGFTALAGGNRRFDGVYADPGLFATGFWWSLKENSDHESWYRYMDYKNSKVFRSHCEKAYGFSVRCVKN